MSNPYSRFKARSLLLWSFIGMLVLGMLLGALNSIVPLDPQTETNLSTIFLYLSLCGWIYYVPGRAGVEVSELIKKGERVNPFLLGGLVILLLTMSVGSTLLLGYLLSYLFPSLLTSGWLSGQPQTQASSLPLLNRLLEALGMVVLAPIIEEVIFRGILLNRWASRWNLRSAILLSSFFFGILHPGALVDASIFGLCMALLYLKSRTLFVPILAHLLNNAIAFGSGLLIPDSDSPPANIIEEFRSAVWLAVACLAISLPPILVFIYRNYPAKQATTPHLEESEDEWFEPSESLGPEHPPYG